VPACRYHRVTAHYRAHRLDERSVPRRNTPRRRNRPVGVGSEPRHPGPDCHAHLEQVAPPHIRGETLDDDLRVVVGAPDRRETTLAQRDRKSVPADRQDRTAVRQPLGDQPGDCLGGRDD
jgi:hypothetical protein